MSPDRDAEEPVTVTDKRRIDPDTGQVREGVPSSPAPSGPGPAGAGSPDQVAELTADLQRVQADFANYRKRALRDQEMAAERAKAVVLSQLLGVLDDLDRARSHGDLETGPLKSVADKLAAALAGLGLLEYGTEGEQFDPALHEAVQHEGDGSAGSSGLVIGSVLRKGYKLGEQVLRHALVGVVDAVGVADAEETSENAESDR